jgi:translation initiation factor 3 subunit F
MVNLFLCLRHLCIDLVKRYSTGSNLNTYSALIQNFYAQETNPHQAVHVAVDTGLEQGEGAGVKAYIR